MEELIKTNVLSYAFAAAFIFLVIYGVFRMSKIDRGRIVKTGLQTGMGTAIPAFGEGAGNAVDAFATALIWAEASTIIVCTDVVVTNSIAAVQSSSRSVPRIRHSVAIHEREMLLK